MAEVVPIGVVLFGYSTVISAGRSPAHEVAEVRRKYEFANGETDA